MCAFVPRFLCRRLHKARATDLLLLLLLLQDTNELTGPLPTDWACLRNLIEIDFSNNRLSGEPGRTWVRLGALGVAKRHGLVYQAAGRRGCRPVTEGGANLVAECRIANACHMHSA